MESIGGYFATLKLVTDETSFKKGIGSLKEASKGLGELVKWTAGLSLLRGVTSGWMALMQRDELILSRTTNLSERELSAWSASVGAAGVSAGQFTGALASLDSRIQRMKLGEVDTTMARSLGMLGIGFQKFATSDASDRTREVMKQALAMQDQRKAAQLVSDLLGSAGQEYFWYLKISGANLDEQLAQARALTFTNEKTKKDAMIFSAELSKSKTGLKEIGGLWGSTFAKQLTPVVQHFNALIVANKDLIRTQVVRFAQDLGKAARDVVGFFERWVPRVVQLTEKLGGLEGIVQKVAVGFAAWRIVQLGIGIGNVVKGIGGLAGAFKALTGIGLSGPLLAFTALFLIIQDLTSSDSVIKELFGPWLETLGKSFDELGKSLKTLWESKGLKEFFKDLLGQAGQAAVGLIVTGIDTLKVAIDALTGVIDVLNGKKVDWGKIFGGIFDNPLSESIQRMLTGGITYKEEIAEGKRKQSIVDYIQAHPGATQAQAAKALGLPYVPAVQTSTDAWIAGIAALGQTDKGQPPFTVDLTITDKTSGGVKAKVQPPAGKNTSDAANLLQQSPRGLPKQ